MSIKHASYCPHSPLIAKISENTCVVEEGEAFSYSKIHSNPEHQSWRVCVTHDDVTSGELCAVSGATLTVDGQ